VDFDVIRHVALGERHGFQNDGELLRLLTHLDDVARLAAVGTDVHALAVDVDVAVVDELTGSEDRRNELGAVDDGVEARFEQADQVLRGVATATCSFLIGLAELLLGDVTIVTLQLLLGAQLQTEVRQLALAALAMLAGAVFTLVDRRLRTTPDVFAKTAVNLVFRGFALAHRIPFQKITHGPMAAGKETRPPLASV